MKKLFLQDGKLMVGEFPEEPKYSTTKYPNLDGNPEHDYLNDKQHFEHNAAVSAAKARAVEVVNPICGAQYEFMEEGQLYDTPEGWTVKIGYQFETVCGPLGKEWNDFSEPQEANYNQHKKLGRIVRKVARLGKGWDGEKFTLLRDQETIATTSSGGIPDSRETANTTIDRIGELYEGLKDLHHGMLMYDKSGEFFAALQELRNIACVAVKSVSPPPQAESQEEVFNEIFNRYSILLEGGYTGSDISKSLRESFAVTRKP